VSAAVVIGLQLRAGQVEKLQAEEVEDSAQHPDAAMVHAGVQSRNRFFFRFDTV